MFLILLLLRTIMVFLKCAVKKSTLSGYQKEMQLFLYSLVMVPLALRIIYPWILLG